MHAVRADLLQKNLLSNQPTPQITMHELPKPTAENLMLQLIQISTSRSAERLSLTLFMLKLHEIQSLSKDRI